MRIARVLCGLMATYWLLSGVPSWGQRMQFATPDALPASPAPVPATVGPGPTATFDGTIQAPPPQWDPYATPGSGPAPLLPQDPYLQFGSPGTVAPPGTTFQRMQKFLQSVQLDYVWMPGKAEREFGIHDADLSATFAIPVFYNTETPLLVTPGFAVNAWHVPSAFVWNLPDRVYDAYLDAAWNPQVMPHGAAGAAPWLSGELSVRIGVYSDFKKLSYESIRYTGKGLAVLAFSPSLKLKAGIWYLDRTRIKLLPAGGIVWTPNSDVCFEIIFPNPKVSRRLSNFGNTQWWCYARGDYGGGAWTVDLPAPVSGVHKLDYNDMRFGVGLEFDNQDFLSGLFEVGVAFERELYTDTSEELDVNTTVYVRGGLVY